MCVRLETIFLAIAWNVYFLSRQIRLNCVLFLYRSLIDSDVVTFWVVRCFITTSSVSEWVAIAAQLADRRPAFYQPAAMCSVNHKCVCAMISVY